VKYKISICILLCLTIIASGQAAAQQTFGTKVNAGDPDVGLPLSAFSPIGGTGGGTTFQNNAYLSYWDIGSTPGLYDDQDVVYLQFGSAAGGANRIIRTNNIRMTGWGVYPPGSYVAPADSDIGQQLPPWAPPAITSFPTAAFTGFRYMNLVGGAGYDIGDPIYLKAGSASGPFTGTNDVRITPVPPYFAGSRVSLADPDAAKPTTAFYGNALGLGLPNAGPQIAATVPTPIASLAFFNANGNTLGAHPIYDDGDVVYFDVAPLGTVSPNDVRLY
jgi:hypothetical protein